MREIKFRAYFPELGTFYDVDENSDFTLELGNKKPILHFHCSDGVFDSFEVEILQYTGLKDKNGVEIYELCELDNQYRVIYDNCSYVLQDILTGDIVGLLDNSIRKANEREITREYSPMEKD